MLLVEISTLWINHGLILIPQPSTSVLHMLPPTTTLSAHLLSAACGCANWLHKAGHVQGHLAHFAFLQTTRGLWPWLLDLNGFSPLACAEEAVVGPSLGMGLGDGLRLP